MVSLELMSIRLFPAGKGGRCVRLTTLPPSCAVVMKSGNLYFLEPSGPLQVCNGAAVPFYYFLNLNIEYLYFFIVAPCILVTLKFLSPTNAPLYYTYKMLKYTVKISHDRSYMFRSIWTIIRQPMPNLAKVTILCRYSVKNTSLNVQQWLQKHFLPTLLNI
jgi:hypothetical protein